MRLEGSRIGIGAMELELGDDYRKAGVGRYVLRVLETLLQEHPEFHKVVFHRPETAIPDEWRAIPHAEFHPTWSKTRSYELIGRDLEPGRRRLDAWFSLGGRVPRVRLRGPRVSMVHDVFWRTLPDTYTDRDRAIHEAKAAQIARYADLVVTNSDHTRREFASAYGRTLDSVFVAPLGLGNLGPRLAGADPAVLEKYGMAAPYFFALSTLEPRKNLPRLLEAFARLAPDFPALNLAIGGGKGWKEGGIFERLVELGIADRVKFLGYVPDGDVPSLFAGCIGFVHAALIEGFGVPVLEAMHYGSPVACADAGSLPEVGGEVPLYFDPTDVSSMERRMRDLLTLADRSGRIEAGTLRAANFTWSQNVKIVLDRMKTWPE